MHYIFDDGEIFECKFWITSVVFIMKLKLIASLWFHLVNELWIQNFVNAVYFLIPSSQPPA